VPDTLKTGGKDIEGTECHTHKHKTQPYRPNKLNINRFYFFNH